MVQLSIPREYWRGFAELRELKEGQIQELVSALAQEEPVSGRTSLHMRMASEVENIGNSELSAITDALISLVGLRDTLRIDIPEFVGTIADAMNQSGDENLALPDEESRESFEAKLAQLLEIDSLEVTAKAIGLSREQAHTIHGNPRVLTDVRPIFSSEPAEISLWGAMVIHALKLEYHEGRQLEELYIALSTREIDDLIEVLERAKSKAEILKQWIQDSPVPYMEAE